MVRHTSLIYILIDSGLYFDGSIVSRYFQHALMCGDNNLINTLNKHLDDLGFDCPFRALEPVDFVITVSAANPIEKH